MNAIPTNSFKGSSQDGLLIRRICDHFGIAFSANVLTPALADYQQKNDIAPSESDRLNAAGRVFGIRFRDMEGGIRDLVNTVSDSGPVIIGKANDEFRCLIVGTRSRSRLLIHENGEDRVVKVRWLQRQMDRADAERTGAYNWILVQPMLAASTASNFHYRFGSQQGKIRPLRRLIGLLKPESRDLRTILIFSVVIGLLSLTTPLAVEAVVNTIAFGQYIQPLIVLSLIVLTFLGFRAGLNVLMTVVTEIIQRKLFVRTVEDLAYRLTRVPLSKWKEKHGPELVNRFFDIVSVQKITAKLFLDTLMLLLQTVIGLTVLAFYHPFLLGYDIGLLVMMSVVLWMMGRGAIKTAIDESEQKYTTAAWLQEIVRHPTTFKFNGGLDFAINRADELTASYINERQSHFRILIRQVTFAMFMQAFAATTLLALGGYLVIQGEMTLGQLVAAELIVTVILGSFAKIGKDVESYYDLMASVDKLGKLFDLPVEPANKFQFPVREGAYDLTLVETRLTPRHQQAVDLEFTRNGFYAIHGASELQRRELMDAMTGQLKPTAGHVLMDEFRIDSLTPESLQENVSLIREIELFAGSVDENIRMGRAGIGSREVNEIVDRIGLRETIAGSEEGYATQLRISGYPFSTGEAIRLVLARALISRPGILFIDGLLDRLSDEATVDIIERLKTFREQTTIIVSTGRGAIKDSADKCLNIGNDAWQLEDC